MPDLTEAETAAAQTMSQYATSHGYRLRDERNPLAHAAVAGAREVIAAAVRAKVAEEIARAIEATIGGYPHNDAARPKLDVAEFANDAAWAAQIARQHATT